MSGGDSETLVAVELVRLYQELVESKDRQIGILHGYIREARTILARIKGRQAIVSDDEVERLDRRLAGASGSNADNDDRAHSVDVARPVEDGGGAMLDPAFETFIREQLGSGEELDGVRLVAARANFYIDGEFKFFSARLSLEEGYHILQIVRDYKARASSLRSNS